MPIQVQGPDGQEYEFPDGTSRETMRAAMAKRYAAPAQSKPAAPKPARSMSSDFYTAAGGMGLSPQAGMLDALQHHLGNIPVAIAQAGVNSGDWLAEKMGIPKSANNAADRINRRVQQREQNYQARTDAPGVKADSYAGAAVGEILPWLTGLGELRAAGILPTIAGKGFVPTAKKGGLLALEGGAMMAAAPVTKDGSYGIQKAAQIGVGAVAAPLLAGGTAVAGKGARYVTKDGRDAIANERLAEMYGTDPATLAALRQQSPIPGYNFTVAQRLATPEAVQAERTLRNQGNTGPAFARQESANNAALRAEAQRLAGDDAAMTAAQQARRDGPGSFWRNNLARGTEDGRYGRAQKHLTDVMAKGGRMSGAERDLLDQARRIAGQVQRGTMDMAEGDAAIRALQPTTRIGQKALEQALGVIDGGMVNPNRIVKELQALTKDTNPTISGAAEKALASLAKNQDGMGWVHGRVLDGLRQNIGKLLDDSAPIGGAGSAEGAAYGPIKAKITNTLDRAIPGYRNNLAAYASASQPINDIEAGRALLGAIDSGGRDAGGNQAVSLTQLKSMLAKDAKSRYPMSPQARQSAEAMLEALQTRSISNNTIAASGPGTAADTLRGSMESPAGQWAQGGLAALLGGAAGGVDGGLLALLLTGGAKAANNSVMKRVGTKAADAGLTAEAIQAYQKRLQNQQSSPLMMMLPYQQ